MQSRNLDRGGGTRIMEKEPEKWRMNLNGGGGTWIGEEEPEKTWIVVEEPG